MKFLSHKSFVEIDDEWIIENDFEIIVNAYIELEKKAYSLIDLVKNDQSQQTLENDILLYSTLDEMDDVINVLLTTKDRVGNEFIKIIEFMLDALNMIASDFALTQAPRIGMAGTYVKYGFFRNTDDRNCYKDLIGLFFKNLMGEEINTSILIHAYASKEKIKLMITNYDELEFVSAINRLNMMVGNLHSLDETNLGKTKSAINIKEQIKKYFEPVSGRTQNYTKTNPNIKSLIDKFIFDSTN